MFLVVFWIICYYSWVVMSIFGIVRNIYSGKFKFVLIFKFMVYVVFIVIIVVIYDNVIIVNVCFCKFCIYFIN